MFECSYLWLFFLNGDMIEEDYMEKLHGFVSQGKPLGLMYRLYNYLYVLKHSLRARFGFSSIVHQFGITQTEGGHSVLNYHSDTRCTYLVLYVDDIVIIGSDHHDISLVK